jgi:hypothetical protein
MVTTGDRHCPGVSIHYNTGNIQIHVEEIFHRLDQSSGGEGASMVANRPQQVGSCASQTGGLEVFTQRFSIFLYHLEGNIGIQSRESIGQADHILIGIIRFAFLCP